MTALEQFVVFGFILLGVALGRLAWARIIDRRRERVRFQEYLLAPSKRTR